MTSLTDRYVHAVTAQLPEAQRADIAQELRGLSPTRPRPSGRRCSSWGTRPNSPTAIAEKHGR